VDLPADAELHVMVRGWAATSDFHVVGHAE
jgi:hypothetical protein